jgi:hypothetical protein
MKNRRGSSERSVDEKTNFPENDRREFVEKFNVFHKNKCRSEKLIFRNEM